MECLIQWQTVLPNGAGVPSLIDSSSEVWWYDLGASMCQEFADSGITDLLNMPEWEGQNLGNNYDTRTEYGLGEKSPLRGGPRESLNRFAAVLKANGMGFHSDLVLAHRDDANHPLKSVTGEVLRYPKDNHCFVGKGVPKDNVAVPSEDFAYLFGQQVSYYSGYYDDGERGNGRGYPKRQLIQALDHLFGAFQKQGGRWDNVKSLDPSLIRDLWYSKGAHHNLWGVGEFWSSNIDQLLWWLDRVEWKSSLFDFPLAFECRNAFNNSGNYPMQKFQWIGLYPHAPYNTVTYVNSHDFDRSANRLIYNMATAYGLILGLEGLPCIYAKDWLEQFGGYGLDDKIKNTLFCRRVLGQGSTVWRYLSHDVIAWERMGFGDAPGCLWAINNSYRTETDFIAVHTKWRNCWLHDYTGHRPDVWADDQGYSVIGVPKRRDAYNVVCYAPHGWEGGTIPVKGGQATQRLEAASDLRLPLASQTGANIMRLWCAPNTEIRLNKTAGNGIHFSVTDEDGNEVVARGNWDGGTKRKGWHTLTAFSPTDTLAAYTVEATYQAPRGL